MDPFALRITRFRGVEMRKFRATATNEKGDTFQFFFHNYNWCGIQEVANNALKKVVDADSIHKKHGPWVASQIDISA